MASATELNTGIAVVSRLGQLGDVRYGIQSMETLSILLTRGTVLAG
jgi:hypothetical protein